MSLQKLIQKIHAQIVARHFRIWNGVDEKITYKERLAEKPQFDLFNTILYGNTFHALTQSEGYVFSQARLREKNEYSDYTILSQEEMNTLYNDAGTHALEKLKFVHCVSLCAISFKLATDMLAATSQQSIRVDILSMIARPHFLMRFVDLEKGLTLYYDPWATLQPNRFGITPVLIKESELDAHLLKLIRIAPKNTEPYATFEKADRIFNLETKRTEHPQFSDDNITCVIAHSSHARKRTFPKQLSSPDGQGRYRLFQERNHPFDTILGVLKGACLLTAIYTLLSSETLTHENMVLRFTCSALLLGALSCLFEKMSTSHDAEATSEENELHSPGC